MKRLALVLLASMVASCGGGGGSMGLPTAPSAAPKSPSSKPVKVTLVLPKTSTSNARRGQYVSPSAQGASITVTGAGGGTGSAVVDLSSASTACTATAGQRACTASVVAPIDTDTFTITLYDAPPSGSVIPSTAHVLGVGQAKNVAITSSFTGSLAVAVGGSVSTIGLSATYLSVPSNGAPQSIPIVVAPADFGNNPLSGSGAPYANPITVTLTESGNPSGPPHMQLYLNGQASGSTAQLKSPSDAVSVQYDGGGSVGYSTTIVLSATGAASQTLTIAPLILSSTSTFFAGTSVSVNGSAVAVPITAHEAGAPSGMTYTATPTGCTNIATLSAVSGSGASATFTVTGGSTSSGSGCSVAVSDSNGTTLSFNVVNSPVGGTIPLPGESIQEYTIETSSPPNPPASPQAVALGPDGKIWIGDVMNQTLWNVTTSGVATKGSATLVDFYPGGLTTGSDGNLYGADTNNTSVDKINPATGNLYNAVTVSYTPHYIANGSDGNVWFTENGSGFGYVGHLSPGGVLVEYDVSSALVEASPQPAGIAANPANSGFWFCATPTVGPEIDAVTYAGAMSRVATSLPSSCSTIAFQPDGLAAWATSASASEVYRIDSVTHVVTTIPLSAQPVQIIAGVDGGMYVTESGASAKIGRISTAAPYALNELAVPNGSPTGVALGADGRVWYGENGQNKMGALTP